LLAPNARTEQPNEQLFEQPKNNSPAGAAENGPAAKPQKRKVATQPDPTHQTLIKVFADGWKDRYEIPYAFVGAADGKHIKDILGAVNRNLAEATAIVLRYLADEDPFIGKQRHSLRHLASNVNRFRVNDPQTQRRSNGNHKGSRECLVASVGTAG
jgi:hypothetical protein